MSTLKTNRTQLGQSGTATQNFTITAEAADGTMKLARGNAGATTQDILTVDAAGKVSATQGYNDVLGAGQTWQNVSGSRVIGTTYTNSTGKPIYWSVRVGGTAGVFTLTVAGVVAAWAYPSSTNDGTGGCIVPAGATYVLNGTGTISGWAELR